MRFTSTAFLLLVLQACGGDASAPDGGSRPDGGGLDSGNPDLGPLPPDPSTIASRVSPSVPSQLADSVAFLYSGPEPVQQGVAPGTIQKARAAVLRGQITRIDGTPFAGALVRVVGHPELGWTQSRLDGAYDLVVNGGLSLTVEAHHPGFLHAQRTIQVGWTSWATVPQMALIELDPKSTRVELGAGASSQLARGSRVRDARGDRTATLLFQAGTKADLLFSDGRRVPLERMTVRATEYTIGDGGPSAMPAELPVSSAYTYAVELSADEAMAAEATSVELSRPTPFYVENFVGISVGSGVPTAWYDRLESAWVPSDDGRVIEVLSVNAGVAEIDVDGDRRPEPASTLTTLGIDQAELVQLARTYSAGAQLWRIPIRHFTPYDHNYGVVPPQNAIIPHDPVVRLGDVLDPDDPSAKSGFGIIEAESRVFRERLSLVGAPFELNYSSSRVPDRTADRVLELVLTGSTTPASLQAIKLQVSIAGKTTTNVFSPASDLRHTFTWDGTDVYGRTLQGPQRATVRLTYEYPGFYALPPSMARSFGLPVGSAGDAPAAQPVSLTRTFDTQLLGLGGFDARGIGLGGWTIDAHHVYDAATRTLLFGDGSQRTMAGRSASTVVTIAGLCGDTTDVSESSEAASSPIGWVNGIAAAADGSIYFSTVARVHRVSNGQLTTVAGTGVRGFSGDGGSALAARLDVPAGMAISSDGTLYFADHDNHRIRMIKDGVITTIVGTGEAGLAGDGGAATAAKLHSPTSIALGHDGELYVADTGNDRIRRIGPDGTIVTLLRCPTCPGESYELPVELQAPMGLAVASDGSLYVGAGSASCVHRLSPYGGVTTVLGSCGLAGGTGDGGPASQARTQEVIDLALDREGTLYVAEHCNHRIRAVAPNGTISTVVGCRPGSQCVAECGERQGSLAGSVKVPYPRALSVTPDGALLYGDADNQLRSVVPAFPGVRITDTVVPSQDGSRLFRFDASGRHIDTKHTLTGATLLSFTYDERGQLSALRDASGNETRIERTDGAPTAIVGPFGDRTRLELNEHGFLKTVENPAHETTSMSYSEGGLLTRITDPLGGAFTMTYDAFGQLTHVRDPADAVTTLDGSRTTGKLEATLESALGRVTRFSLSSAGGEEVRSVDRPDGVHAESRLSSSGDFTWVATDGSQRFATLSPDPEYGMVSPLASVSRLQAPSGLDIALTSSRQGARDGNWIETSSVGGSLAFKTQYEASTRTLTRTTAEGRVFVRRLDEQGREIERRVGDSEAIRSSFDPHGNLVSVEQGTGASAVRMELSYDARGRVDGARDPEGASSTLERDDAGRLIRLVSPTNDVTELRYDGAGRTVGIKPPGKPEHIFIRDARGRLTRYVPPIEEMAVAFENDADGSPATVSGALVSRVFNRDGSGRLVEEVAGTDRVAREYVASTGELGRISTPRVSLAFSRDGTLIKGLEWSGDFSGAISFTYDALMRLAGVGVGSSVVDYAYDADGMPIQVGILELEYGPTGALLRTSANSVVTHHAVDSFGRPDELSVLHGSTVLARFAVDRDKVGRVIRRVETVADVSQTTEYEYDPSGRLTAVRENGADVESYSFDGNGNRTRELVRGVARVSEVDAADRMTRRGTIQYTYDDEGRCVEQTDLGQTVTYEYDGFHRLRGVRFADGRHITYLLDGQHSRLAKYVDDVFVRGFLWRAGRIEAEVDESGAVISRFSYSNASPVPDMMSRAGRAYRIISDFLGSPRLIVDTVSGEIVQRLEYDAFGRVLSDTQPGFQPFGFAGGLWDAEARVVQFGARTYDPESGRWMSRDPAIFWGGDTNLYAYVRNDPVNQVDRTGLGPQGLSIYELAYMWNDAFPGEDTRWAMDGVVEDFFGFELSREEMVAIDHMNTAMHTMQWLVPTSEYDHWAVDIAKRSARLFLAVPGTLIPMGYEACKSYDQTYEVDVFGPYMADTKTFNTPDTSRATLMGWYPAMAGLFMSSTTRR